MTDANTTSKFIKIHNFWPQGPDCPLAFCTIEGREGGAHSGNKRSSVFSKCNELEANKVVCYCCCRDAPSLVSVVSS